MNLAEIANSITELEGTNHSVLLYGPPKSGKTRLAGTAAQIPEIKSIVWFDLENGIQTLLHMGLTKEELAKITVHRIADTRADPIAIETLLKAFSARKDQPAMICHAHGRVSCTEAACKAEGGATPFALGLLDSSSLVVIDSGSQLGDSALNSVCRGRGLEYKPTFNDYGNQNRYLGDIMSVVQQAHHTNFLVITHEILIEEEINGVTKDKIFPLLGSRQFSMKVAKYFGTVAYLHLKLGKHAAGSASTYKGDTITGSRVNALLEKSASPSMKDIFMDAGILAAGKQQS